MKVLLTGGAGYIGSHTAVELLNAGHEVVIADNLSNSCRESISRVEELCGKKITFYQIDVTDSAEMNRLFAGETLDAVVHFAGLKAVGESVEKPLAYYRNNLDATMTVLEMMVKHGVRNLVFSSSATVYGGGAESPLDETMPTWCTNPYGWTKFMGERIITDFVAANRQISAVLLRYFNPVGAHESGRIGEDPAGIPNNLMPYISQVAIGRRDKLHVFGNDYDTPDGTGVRDYLHVVDLARGHVCALRYAQEHSGTEIINLGTGHGYSVLDVVHAFESANHVPIPYVVDPRRSGDLATCFANAKKAEEVLGWKAEHSIEDMCRDSWNWQRNNPNGYRE